MTDISEKSSRYRERDITGGATFRFAIEVRLGKCWPEECFESESDVSVAPQFKRLIESLLNQEFYEVNLSY